MELQIRHCAIVDFDVGRGSGPNFIFMSEDRGDINLPMLIFDRFRVVGHVRGAGPCESGGEKSCAGDQ